MPDLQAIAFSNLVTSFGFTAVIVALAPLGIVVPWVGVGVVPSFVYFIWHPPVVLVTLTEMLPDSEVPPAGLNIGCATWLIDWALACGFDFRESSRKGEKADILAYRAFKVCFSWAAHSVEILNSPLFELARLLVRSITLPASDPGGPRFSFWVRPSLFRPRFFKSYVRSGASMIAPSLPIASTGQPSIASLQSASSSGVSGCL